jgi:hypothetical protein
MSIVRRLLKNDIWRIGYIDMTLASSADGVLAPKWIEIPTTWRQYVADPFVFSLKEKIFLVYELYDYILREGKIACSRLNDRFEVLDSYLLEGITDHASYPYIFEYKGQMYMVPENISAGVCSIYSLSLNSAERLTITPTEFFLPELGEDPTIYYYDGKWWLWMSQKSEILNLYYKSKLSDEWTPHVNNPIIKSRKIRPAGPPFILNGTLYRPSQDCSSGYGGRIIINEILKLNQMEYLECPSWDISPSSWGEYSHGVHTISEFRFKLIIDAKSKRFVFAYSVGLIKLLIFRYLSNLRFFNNFLIKSLSSLW